MIETLINRLPKAELHLHIEGSLMPALMMQLAEKHQVSLPYKNLQEVEQAYQFEDLQSFLDLYYLGASVLIDEDDFYQLMWDYLCRCKQDNVVHTEIMFDPQTHTQRGIEFSVFMAGFKRAIEQAKAEWGMSVMLILSFLRHLSEDEALQTLNAAQNYLCDCVAVGLDSSEVGNPPEKFSRAFSQASKLGLKKVAHAGEEGPPEYIWSALNTLQVDRVDHGVRSIEDPSLIAYLKEKQIPLTVCPLSNIKLRVFDVMNDHNILNLLAQGLLVTVNADDPSYFGGYLNDNYHALNEAFQLTQQQLVQLVKNSFIASFLDEQNKLHWLQKIDMVVNESMLQ
jgi:adenosine deaminase